MSQLYNIHLIKLYLKIVLERSMTVIINKIHYFYCKYILKTHYIYDTRKMCNRCGSDNPFQEKILTIIDHTTVGTV